jgi:hypothetical protein
MSLDWSPIPSKKAAEVRERVRTIVGDVDATAARLARYYRPGGKYAGETFLALPGNDLDQISAADLYAVSLLGVTVKPAAARRLLDDPTNTADIHTALRTTPNVDLAVAGDADLRAASRFYDAVHAALRSSKSTSDPWVTASKLAARKRPRLIPVRDSLVRKLLDTGTHTVHADWLLYRDLVRDRAIIDSLTHALESVGQPVRDPLLRVLDVALWTMAFDSRL